MTYLTGHSKHDRHLNMPVAGSSNRGACHTEACAIQDCLANNNYDMGKCQDKVDKLKKCCSGNTMQESVHCAFLNSVPGTDSGASQSPDDQVLRIANMLLHACRSDFAPCATLFGLACDRFTQAAYQSCSCKQVVSGVQVFRSHSGTPSGGSKKQA